MRAIGEGAFSGNSYAEQLILPEGLEEIGAEAFAGCTSLEEIEYFGKKGVEIAKASDRLIGIALGAEDYVADLKTTRSDGIELLFARCMILNAARAAGIAALDTVFSNVNDEEGFIAEATLIKKLGFDGKSVINPRQIEPLHKVFMPSEKDLNKARAIMEAIAEANARGSGVASLNGKMIDKPVVTRAKRLLELYEAGSKADEVEEL